MAAPQAELLSWAEAAEQCCLPELRLRCLTEVARRLAHGGDSLAATFGATAERAKGGGPSTLRMRLGLLAAGCGPTGAPRVAEITPAAGAKALEASSKYGSFEWVVERYSQLPAAVGQNAYSPYCRAAGIDWRFKVHPVGNKAEAAGHISGGCACLESRGVFRQPLSSSQPHQNGTFCLQCSLSLKKAISPPSTASRL